MGISFGSASKKPYVGSKEVQEAYVGSQKVYSAAPPYVFLGGADSYYLSPLGQLGTGCAIVKHNKVYQVAPKSAQTSDIGNGFKILKGTHTLNAKITGTQTVSGQMFAVVFKSDGSNIGYTPFTFLNQQKEINIELPTDYAQVNLILPGSAPAYINEVQFVSEPEGLLTRRNYIAVPYTWSKEPSISSFGNISFPTSSNVVLTALPSGFTNLNGYFPGNPTNLRIDFLNNSGETLSTIACTAEMSGTNQQWEMPTNTLQIRIRNVSSSYGSVMPYFTLS